MCIRDRILIDAVRIDEPAGSPVRLDGEDVGPAIAHRLSPHQVGVAELMDAARLRGRHPRDVVLLGLVPETLETRLGLSDSLASAVPALVERVAEEADRLGHPLRRRANAENAAVSFIDSRKKLPDRVTKVRPTAMMPTSAASRMIVFKLNSVRKLGAVTMPKMNTTRNKMTSPITSGE